MRIFSLACLITVSALVSTQASQQPRDLIPAPPGDATIRGTVLSDDPTPEPLRRAVVTVSGAGLPLSRSVIADDAGGFSIAGLPAGRVTVTATKSGYLQGSYGARRPGRPGTPVILAAGGTREISIALVRASVLTGTVRDERAEPVAGLRVFAINALKPTAPQPVRGGGMDNMGLLTDDRGMFRLSGLPPGEYFVVAVPPSVRAGQIMRRSTEEMDALLSRLGSRGTGRGIAAGRPATTAGATAATLAPVFYPGTHSMTEAGRITLAAGEIRDRLDFVTTSIPVTTIAGTVVNAAGPLPPNLELSIAPADTLQFFALASSSPQLVKRSGADGSFEFSTVSPGPYVIRARGNRAAVPEPPVARGSRPPDSGSGAGRGRGAASEPVSDQLYAVEAFDVVGAPITGLTLTLQPASEVRGRVVFDGSRAAPADLSAVRVDLQPAVRTGTSVRDTIVGSTFTSERSTVLRADGTFVVTGLAPGTYYVRVTVTGPTSPGEGWWLRSAVASGRDVLDSTLAIQIGEDVSDALLTLTDRRTELSGTLQTSGGLPAPEYFVVVFPADSALRVARSRRVKAARPATDGTFSFTNLPPGDYRLVALTDIEPGEWDTLAFLNTIAAEGVSVRVDEAPHTRQDLRILGR